MIKKIGKYNFMCMCSNCPGVFTYDSTDVRTTENNLRGIVTSPQDVIKCPFCEKNNIHNKDAKNIILNEDQKEESCVDCGRKTTKGRCDNCYLNNETGVYEIDGFERTHCFYCGVEIEAGQDECSNCHKRYFVKHSYVAKKRK